ncbi:MAG: hypothetical protein HC876_08630 [Chloroflexaceae bacterium]|nr:hypothetical protein [Chloroflexaceae bacterium]
MMLTVTGMLMVPTALFLLIVGLRYYQRQYRPHPEIVRKLLHIGMGLVCLPFPWLFDGLWPVLILGSMALGALLLLRHSHLRETFGCTIHQVKRHSYGDLYFPLGVALAYLLAQDNALLYSVPLLLLTFADPTAALVGTFWGRRRYRTIEGTKTLEGSAAFFGVAFVLTLTALLLAGTFAPVSAVLVAGLLALIATAIEGISWRGIDNLLVPAVSGELLLGLLHVGPVVQAGLLLLILSVALIGAAIWFIRRVHLSVISY